MTYKEKLTHLSQSAAEKADRVSDIEKDFDHAGFHKYSVIDYMRVHDEHADAVNAHGKIIREMLQDGRSLEDLYME